MIVYLDKFDLGACALHGAKGVLCLHPGVTTVVIRHFCIKVKPCYRVNGVLSQRIIDLLAVEVINAHLSHILI